MRGMSSFQGKLKIQLQNGPAITIPNDALIVPEQRINGSGYVQSNDSASVSLFTADPDPENPNPNLVVGGNFFSGAYLTVDLDERTWSIWAVNATTDSRLQRIGGDTCKPPSVSPSIDSAADHAANEPETSSLTTGAIAGVVIGAIAALTTAVGLGLCLFARRKSKRHAGTGNSDAASSSELSGNGMRYGDTRPMVAGEQLMPEMRGDTAFPTELHACRDPSELPYNNFKASELPHDNDEVSRAELAYHISRRNRPSQAPGDAVELSSSPATGS